MSVINTIEKTTKDLAKNKYVKIGAAVGGAYILYRVIRSAARPATAPNVAKDDVSKFMREGQRQSYPNGQYHIFADAIYSAGFDYLFGTDDTAMYSIFSQMNNNLDVAKLIVAFGTRRKELSGQSGSLGEFIASEMNSGERAKINKILASKGISYRF